MTYGSQITTRTRHPFTTGIKSHGKRTKKRTRARFVKRVVHFLGFLAYWSVVLSVTYLVTLAVLIVFILLA